jgi:hypothetical protein
VNNLWSYEICETTRYIKIYLTPFHDVWSQEDSPRTNFLSYELAYNHYTEPDKKDSFISVGLLGPTRYGNYLFVLYLMMHFVSCRGFILTNDMINYHEWRAGNDFGGNGHWLFEEIILPLPGCLGSHMFVTTWWWMVFNRCLYLQFSLMFILWVTLRDDTVMYSIVCMSNTLFYVGEPWIYDLKVQTGYNCFRPRYIGVLL